MQTLPDNWKYFNEFRLIEAELNNTLIKNTLLSTLDEVGIDPYEVEEAPLEERRLPDFEFSDKAKARSWLDALSGKSDFFKTK